MKTLARLALSLAFALPFTALALPALPPHLGEAGQTDYRAYLDVKQHRAFVIAPGGAWAWVGEYARAETALEDALASCRRHTEQTCVPWAVDDKVVFDAKAWPTLWRPYASAAAADAAPAGMQRGQRFPELALRSPAGKPMTLAQLRGQAVVLHFWASWCAPCRKELPDLAANAAALAGERNLAFVLLQVREPIADSRRYLKQLDLKLPLHDSGARGSDDQEFRLADGGRLADRQVAMAFPTTYVLDRHGVVVFRHVGPIHDWRQYAAFLRDVAAQSGK